jgi:2-Cys peroxiredoxin 5
MHQQGISCQEFQILEPRPFTPPLAANVRSIPRHLIRLFVYEAGQCSVSSIQLLPHFTHQSFFTTETFQAKSANMVQAGDSIPSVELTEGNPGGKVNLATELASGPGLIIGVPAAFSKTPPVDLPQ